MVWAATTIFGCYQMKSTNCQFPELTMVLLRLVVTLTYVINCINHY